MKYISYLVIIILLAGAGYFIYDKYWTKPKISTSTGITIPEKPPVKPERTTPEPPPIIIDTRVKKENPAPPKTGLAALIEKANVAAKKKDVAAVYDTYREIMDKYPESEKAAEAAMALGEKAFAEDKLFLARAYFTRAHDALPPAERDYPYKKILAINEKLVWGPRVYPDCKDTTLYKIQPGDSLAKIAAKFNCPWRLIKKINRMKNSNIHAGQAIKVVKGIDSDNMEIVLKVDKSEFTLTAYLNGYILKKYPVGIGRDDLTPETTFEVFERIKHPTWQKPGESIPYGDPRNILGDYYIKFKHKMYNGFGLHGIKKGSADPADPTSIQKAESAGCIRMFNKDVAEIYVITPRGSKVIITK